VVVDHVVLDTTEVTVVVMAEDVLDTTEEDVVVVLNNHP
jgi:hypothetical protein